LDWPIGLNASAIKSGTRLYIPKEEVAEPYRRGMHRVFSDIGSPQNSALRFAQGDVGEVLARLSAYAALLVIGTHEPVRRRPYYAGSINHYCISHASCPVVTVPEPKGMLDHDTRHPAISAAAASRAAADGYRKRPSPGPTKPLNRVNRQSVNAE
jgi:hypothetical protein